jgi:hypothetical protein
MKVVYFISFRAIHELVLSILISPAFKTEV